MTLGPAPGTAPIVPVSDLTASLAFYKRCLGFAPVLGNPAHGYALLRRDALMIALINAADDAALAATRQNISAQLWVPDLGALWASVKAELTALSEDRSRAPFDRDYGVREFHVKDPDGFLMIFTQLPAGPG